jgi:plastocyanin
MRSMTLVAGLAMAMVACGGAKEKPAAPADQGAAPAAAAAPAATGATHDVKMVLDGKDYKFDPAALTIKAGDVVRFHNTSGGPHNVSFWPDSIPAGANTVLDANMKDRMAPLSGPMLVDPDAVYEVSFAGAPAGVYHLYCVPHLAFKMHGVITVQ